VKVAATFTRTSEATFTLSRPIKKRKKVEKSHEQTNKQKVRELRMKKKGRFRHRDKKKPRSPFRRKGHNRSRQKSLMRGRKKEPLSWELSKFVKVWLKLSNCYSPTLSLSNTHPFSRSQEFFVPTILLSQAPPKLFCCDCLFVWCWREICFVMMTLYEFPQQWQVCKIELSFQIRGSQTSLSAYQHFCII
jgi:hypothetical protein